MTSFLSNFTFKNVAVSANWTSVFPGMTWAGDLNQDGKDDLIVLGMSFPPSPNAPQQGGVFLGDGKGNFAPAPTTLFPIESLKTVHPREILSADFNADGRTDILIISHGYDTAPFPGEQNRLFLSQANGAWIDATSNLPQLLDFSHSAAIGDINGDGTQDIYVGNINGQKGITPYLLLNDGSGHFTRTTAPLPTQLQSMFPFFYTSSLLVDLNNDSRLDLVAGLAGNGRVGGSSMVFWNIGTGYDSGHLTTLPSGQVSDDNRIVLSIASVDINRDGLLDLVTLSTLQAPFYVGEFIDVYLNSGNNGFRLGNSEVLQGITSLDTGGWSSFLRVVDANGDGQLDVTLSEYSGSLASPQSPFMLLNDGAGHLLATALQDMTSNSQPFRFNALPFHTDQGLSFLTVYTQNGSLFANELIATSPLPALATSTRGGDGSDRFFGTAANESFDGGAGLDSVVMRGHAIEYRLGLSNGAVTLTDTVLGRDGQDTFVQVERLQFQDKILAFDFSGDAGQAYRMYQAAFARTPDKDGVSFWVSQVDKGVSLHDMATAFIGSNEFKGIYGANPSVDKLVTGFYTNVLGRAPDASGLSFWVGQVQSGLSTADMLVSFSESGENKAHVAPAIQNGIELSLSFFA